MDLTVNPKSLAAALAAAAGATERRTSMPILSCVFLSAVADRLAVTGTDMELTLKTLVEADVSKDGRACVSASKLASVIKDLPGDKVHLRINGDNLEVLSGFFSANLPGLDPDGFPSPPETAEDAIEVETTAGQLGGWLAVLAPSISQDDTRYNLTGIHWSRPGKTLRLQSTDGHRLARLDTGFEVPAGILDKAGLVLPRKAVSLLAKLVRGAQDAKVTMWCQSGLVVAEFGNTTLFARTSDGNYPDTDVVIPKNAKRSALVNRQALAGALTRVGSLTTDRWARLSFNFTEEGLLLEAATDAGRAKDLVDVDLEGGGVSLGFNGRYWSDACSVMQSDQVRIEVVDDISPAKLTGEGDPGLIIVIMPMRL